MKQPIDTAKTLSRLRLLGEDVKPMTLITHIEGRATYPFLRFATLRDGREIVVFGLFNKGDGWVTDSSATLGDWSISLNQNREDFDHLKIRKP